MFSQILSYMQYSDSYRNKTYSIAYNSLLIIFENFILPYVAENISIDHSQLLMNKNYAIVNRKLTLKG